MANTDVVGWIRFSEGSSVPLENLAMAESATGLASTAVELQTDASYTVNAQSIGSYAQGQTMVAAWIGCETNGSNAYVDRQGLPLAFLSICRSGAQGFGLIPTKKIVFKAGDTIKVCNAANATRTMALTVRTQSGQERCFVGTSSGGATTSLVDTVTPNTIGQTLAGQPITSAMCQSVDGVKISSGGGAVILNSKGDVVGGLGATNSTINQPQWVPMNTKIGINHVAQYITSS